MSVLAYSFFIQSATKSLATPKVIPPTTIFDIVFRCNDKIYSTIATQYLKKLKYTQITIKIIKHKSIPPMHISMYAFLLLGNDFKKYFMEYFINNPQNIIIITSDNSF